VDESRRMCGERARSSVQRRNDALGDRVDDMKLFGREEGGRREWPRRRDAEGREQIARAGADEQWRGGGGGRSKQEEPAGDVLGVHGQPDGERMVLENGRALRSYRCRWSRQGANA